MIKLKDLLLEVTEPVMDLDMAKELAARLNKETNAPFVQAQISTLGGQRRPSVMLKISLDPKESWINNIFHNSRYSMWDIAYDGTMEQHAMTHTLSKKFRKTRFKTAEEVVKKINAYIKQVD